jgi:hypothetical protein
MPGTLNAAPPARAACGVDAQAHVDAPSAFESATRGPA